MDSLLVSKALFDTLQSVGIERRCIFGAELTRFPEMTDKTTQASDRAAAFAWFNF